MRHAAQLLLRGGGVLNAKDMHYPVPPERTAQPPEGAATFTLGSLAASGPSQVYPGHLVLPLKSISQAASATAIFVGCAVLLGWTFDIPALKSIVPVWVTMKANTATGFILSGLSVWLLVRGRANQRARQIARVCAVIVALIGALTLAEYVFGRDLRIDQLLFKEESGAVGTFSPGRMAPNTALNFLTVGLALLLLDVETRRGHRPAQLLALTSAFVGLLAFLGYAYGVTALYTIASYTRMAAHTALTFIILSLGILFARPERGVMAILTSENLGGVLARRLLPAAIGIPSLLGWLRLVGERAGLYDAPFGTSLFVLATMVLFAALIGVTSRSLHQTEIERKRADEQIQRLNDTLQRKTAQLEAANKELEAFSYSVSHDLRAPLRAMSGFSRILAEDHAPHLPEEAQRYLRLVRNNAEQMGRLIDDLLTFSRLSRQPLNRQAVAPADVARQALSELQAEQEGRQVEIIIDDVPMNQADPALLKQVFVNLLSNALKFTRRREVAAIHVGSRREGNKPVYFVRDNGVGFDMRYADQLFGVFQRLHRPEDYEGTGVGLAIVQRIVTRHGGRVWVEAEADKGAIFYFTIGG